MQGLLRTDENKKILKTETAYLFFKPQAGEGAAAALNAILRNNEVANNAMGGMSQNIDKDWGLGGLLLCGDGPDGKQVGTMI